MEFIKASERLPLEEKEYFCKANGCKNILLFEGGEFWIDNSTVADKKRLEWLSEFSPTPKQEDDKD